jgi:hemoglobin
MKRDIQTHEDIRLLVETFYDKVRKDELLSPKFAHLDLEQHLPTMYRFWESMLLGTRTYQGNPLQAHIPLGLVPEHFSQWLKLWHQTIGELFSGPVASEAMMRADSIAGIFKHKLGLIE